MPITNDAGEPVDYLFLQANLAFEAMIGLKVEDIMGRRVTEVLPGIGSGDFDWIGTFGQVALTGESVRITNFGVFEVKERKARQGRNPRYPDEVLDIPPYKAPGFRAGRSLKEKVRRS